MSKSKKNNKLLTDLEIQGKVTPQAIDVEEIVLGTIIAFSSSCYKVLDLLKEECFYGASNLHVYKAIRTLYEKNEVIDIITVCSQLRKDGKLEEIGGAYFISTLTNRIASDFHIEQHARILQEKAIQRKLIEHTYKLAAHCFDPTKDIFELMQEADDSLQSITDLVISGNATTIKQVLKDTIKEIELTKNHDGIIGCKSGFKELDNITYGFQKKQLYILAARPQVGKTTLAMDIVRYASMRKLCKPLIFSLEMTSTELGKKMLSAEGDIDFSKLKKGELVEKEWLTLQQVQSHLSETNMFIEDKAGLTMHQIRDLSKKYKKKEGIDMVIIDHLQKVTLGDIGRNREQEVNKIADMMKNMAKDLDLPVIALSQLSRAVDTRPDKVPILSDLRESGGIEQEADVVMFIYRPVIYGITEDASGNDVRDLAKIIIAKNRGGSTGDFNLRFNGEKQRFENLISDYQSNNITLNNDFLPSNSTEPF